MSKEIGDSRTEAKALRLKRYHGGTCPRCNGVLRFTSNRNCVPCKGAILKERRAKFDVPLNSLRIAAPTYIGRPCKRGHDGTRYVRDQSCVECTRLRHQARRADPEKRAREKVTRKAWKRKCGRSRQRRAANRPLWMTPDMDQAYYNERNGRNAAGEQVEIDHFYPKKGRGFSGLDVPWNLIVIDKATNNAKGNKHPRDFYGEDFDRMAKLVADTYETMKEFTDAQYSIAA